MARIIMKKWTILLYGVLCYLCFLGVFVYAIGFLGNLWVPTSLDSAPETSLALALAIDFGLLAAFSVQHSLMARPFFKTWLTRFIPRSIERSTYVLASCLCMIALFLLWEPLGGDIWRVTDRSVMIVIYSFYFLGWAIIFLSTCLQNHFDLFGLRQVWLEFQGKPYTYLKFKTPFLYQYVRHPLYIGWMITFWATPFMSMGHFIFALGTTIYILIAIPMEERDLEDVFGVAYASYRNEVPALIPRLGTRSRQESGAH
jgi:protein-S-isoprenylcysteine O-methyltransferase Ste14